MWTETLRYYGDKIGILCEIVNDSLCKMLMCLYLFIQLGIYGLLFYAAVLLLRNIYENVMWQWITWEKNIL